MIRLTAQPMTTVADLQQRLQQAIELEFSTLPPYLYTLYSIQRDSNQVSYKRILDIVREEMIHMCLACNILNAIGGSPRIADREVVPTYPGPLPGDIGSENGEIFEVGLIPFSPASLDQAMRIEEPDEPIEFLEARLAAAAVEPDAYTIGEFYHRLDQGLSRLPASAWPNPARKQIGDQPFFPGELFPVTAYDDAHRAILRIVSQGEGNPTSPLDFEGEVSHYYRFSEIRRDQVLEKADNPQGFVWGAPLGVNWEAVMPAISNPSEYDFSYYPEAQAAQDECDLAFTKMLQELQLAVSGQPQRLGNAVRFMFDLRLAAIHAFATPLQGLNKSAGPAFRYRPELG